ncbi:hypothetical protein ACFOTA_14140 [Chitinophaga sp. GCM10012297]|uniref:DUF1642 domain-containing protein n=1 Tax=Chitinophaga chungangae TaxID=2821488 RepID=A0ABS3YF94_9BACT|nr:hypothetical protein [Chitinophaga chungangae]MBO9153357.1 hypothetical protein [Chitinophaga chungangae]
MSYYTRVLGTQNPDIHLDELLQALEDQDLSAKFMMSPDETADKWTVIQVNNKKGEPLVQIEKNPVAEEEAGGEELEELRENIKECQPASAAKWLDAYFSNVKVIYAFQMLNASLEDENFPIVEAVKEKIWNLTGGILQADDEGFSNEDGYHILWQFSDDATGEWHCAVLNENGQWEQFRMELGDMKQRKDFLAGKVPVSAKRVK